MDNQRAILVSGAAGGIGTAGCRQLAEAGFTVFAGALGDAEVQGLRSVHPNVKPVHLDVTKSETLASAVASVSEALQGAPLYGCWSNAGIMRISAFQNLAVADIRQVLDVNLAGAMLFLHAALPLLERGRSRVVITGSATGMLAGPAVSVYTATKWGLEGFADALRIELGRVGITLSLIQPGLVATPMATAATPSVDRLLAGMSAEDRRDYETLVRTIADTSAKASTPPEKVAAAVVDAFTSARPRTRYRVGADSKVVALLRHLPDSSRDFLQRKMFKL
ncbi:MAG TPA: SDR family NAD(P)-dependent oxidoreductase [Nevskiaceae bacterium]|nr:SDR family NAD(P)-dependent oxidoreductase [Nevskiaceae bacterium]